MRTTAKRTRGHSPGHSVIRGVRRSLQNAIRIIDRWLDYQRVCNRIPGLSVGLVHGDEIVFANGYGYADVRRRRRATRATCYRIASISKVFTATAVMQLIERGTVRLEDRAQQYVPWLRSHQDKRLENVTIRQLLTHTAGVERDAFAHWENDRFPMLEQLKMYVQHGRNVYAPLERWKYSNLGYAILGQIIAAASGQRYEDYVHAMILEPLRLRHTSPRITQATRRRLAVGYGRDIPDRPRETFGNPETNAMCPATGLASNAVDLCTFMAAQFIGSRRLLSDLSKREMQRIHWVDGGGSNQYGLGCQLWTIEGTPIVGHSGGFQGFNTAIGMDTEKKIGVAVLTNAIDGPAQRLMRETFRVIHDCAKLTGSPALPPRSRRSLHRYEGRFTGRWWDLEIVALGDRLVAYDPSNDRPLHEVYGLVHLGGTHFRIATGSGLGNLGEKVTFRFDSKGKLTALQWGPTSMKCVSAAQ